MKINQRLEFRDSKWKKVLDQRDMKYGEFCSQKQKFLSDELNAVVSRIIALGKC